MVSALSALAHDRSRFAAAYGKAIQMIAFVGCLFSVLLGVTAEESVRLIYGPTWAPVVPLVLILSFPAAVVPIYNTTTWLFLSVGKSKQMFLLTVFLTPLVAAAYLCGVAWGTAGIALTNAFLFTLPIPVIALAVAHRAAGLPLLKTLQSVAPIVGCGAAAALAAWGAGYAGQRAGIHWAAILALKLMVGTAVYLALAAFWVRPSPLPRLETVLALLRRSRTDRREDSSERRPADEQSPKAEP